MRIKVKSFFTEPLLFYIIVLNYMKPDSFSYIGLPEMIVRISLLWDRFLSIPVILLCVLFTLTNYKNKMIDVIAFYGYKILGTVILTYLTFHMFSGGGAFAHLRKISVIWYLTIAMRLNYKSTITRLSYLLSILVVTNFASIILFPHGMYVDDNWQNYFLGYDNGHIVVFMPALFFATLHAHFSKRKTIFFVTWCCVLASIFICRSGTTVVGIVTLMAILILIYFPVVRKFLFNWKVVLIVIAGVFFLIVILRRHEAFQDLMMKYLGKDGTFTGRVYLWDKAIEVFMQHKWFGVGDSPELNQELFTLFNQKLSYAHNEILDLLVRSGIVGLGLYFVCIVRSVFYTKHQRSLFSKTWLAFMASYWLIMMFESYSSYAFYYLYFVMLIVPRFTDVEQKKRKGLITA